MIGNPYDTVEPVYEETAAGPELEELLQEDPPQMAVVPVQHDGPLGTYKLPNRRVILNTYSADDTKFWPVMDATPKRSRAVIVSMDDDILIRTSSSGTGTVWPQAVPYNIEHTESIAVQCATSSTTSRIGVTEEFWAD
jgi:hypothetical protein